MSLVSASFQSKGYLLRDGACLPFLAERSDSSGVHFVRPDIDSALESISTGREYQGPRATVLTLAVIEWRQLRLLPLTMTSWTTRRPHFLRLLG